MKTICSIGIALLSAVLLLLLGTKAPVYGQTLACDPVITVLDDAIENCKELNTNWACYGHETNLVLPTTIRFVRPKDRQPIEVIEEISTEFRNGATLLRLQLEAEYDPVTAILFGAMNLQPDRHEQANNLFLLRFEDDELLCENTPSGMVVRTDSGQRGRITLNNVDIELGSTVFITLRNPNAMEVINVDGNVTVTVDALDVSRRPAAGESVQITLQNNLPLTVTVPGSATITSPVLQWLANDDNGLSQIIDSNTISNPVVPACGGIITFDQPMIDEHHVPGQECLFTFTGTSGDIVTIHSEALDGGLDPWIDLRDPTMQLIKANNDIDEAEDDSLICNNRLVTSGPYTIVARPYDNESIGRFRLTLNRASDCQEPVVQAASAPQAAPICRPSQPGGWIGYRVSRGDTLSGLAVNTGTNVARLMEVNCLSTTLIWIGQRLYVPSPPCSGLVITGFTIIPGPASATASWRAAGGCAPLGGTLTVRYNNGFAASFAVAGVGTVNLAYPAGDTCPLSGVYSLSMRDRSGLGASVVRSVTLRNDCPKDGPYAAP